MTLLVLGLLLWVAGHFFKRALPGVRERMGNAGRGASAIVIIAGLVVMVIGYRGAYTDLAYAPPAWGIHLNNLLMLAAVILVGMGNSRGRMRSWLRHPMLSGVVVWAVAHLLVNGDWASVILFGTLAVWAVAEMVVINTKEPSWVRAAPGSVSGDIKLIAISIAVFAAIAGIHTWLGYWPFPG